jgi:CysZ protein
MLSDAFGSFIQMFSPPFRRVMWKSVGLTAIVLFLLGLGLDRLASSLMPAAPAWLSWILSIAVALGLIASMTLLAAPTASLVASFYLDDIADVVEREIDPTGPRGRPLPVRASLYVGLRFAALSLIVNLAVLALTLFTGIGFAAFFVLNGYLLGREYLELAAMRVARNKRVTFQTVLLRRSRNPRPASVSFGVAPARSRGRSDHARRAGTWSERDAEGSVNRVRLARRCRDLASNALYFCDWLLPCAISECSCAVFEWA